MSTEWAIPTLERERNRKELNKKLKSGGWEQKQDKRMYHCTNCKIVFQPTLFADKRFCEENEIEVYVDFPTIGKKRVDSCPNCKSKSK